MMTNAAPAHLTDVRPGQQLPVLHRRPTRVSVFLFGVAYWTSHRIHYDVDAAREEGFGDVVVTANLLSAYSVEMLTHWTGDMRCVLELEERNLAPAVAGDALTMTGRVLDVSETDGERRARCSLLIAKDDGTTVVSGHAVVRLPDSAPTARRK
jgi:hydroxyacyl-ACP dehydratase HTD2-like protein with hotdog domain